MAEVRKKKCRVTAAKAKEFEFELVRDFVVVMEDLFDTHGGFVEEWWTWPDDDDTKKQLRKIQKELGCEEEDDQVLLEFVKRRFRKANYCGSFGRILFNCETLIDNCCDPDLDYLEFKPSIMHANRIAIEKVEKIITNGEEKGLSADDILADIKKHIEEIKKQDEEE